MQQNFHKAIFVINRGVARFYMTPAKFPKKMSPTMVGRQENILSLEALKLPYMEFKSTISNQAMSIVELDC